ncbi:uncharacterized protein LOC119305027 [Triticum dicoccoides]|uniref:uncharacterized protein LOC119305027 n=1 Tax=Triticum dicoccoides TaxID=85692 RepID=UPI00188E36B1|nr:uncharacterized protein LOC119305027 [Triticum dicoccoides]
MAQMVELTSRCLALAEGVVTMVCPVLLALAIKKINWKGKVEEPVVPMATLLIASVTLITGIYPLLACCVSKFFPNMAKRCTHVSSSVAAHLSSICLILLACFISGIILPLKYVVAIGGAVILVAIGVLLILRSCANASQPNTITPSPTGEAEEINKELGTKEAERINKEAERIRKEADERIEKEADERRKEIHDILDKTHEFMSGVTGILFLGLEGLALEGLISTCHGIPDAVRRPVMFSFIFCAIGASLMFLTMIYPLTVTTEKASIVRMTFGFDLLMTGGTVAILTIIMEKLMGHKGLLLLSSPALILFDVVYRLVIKPGVALGTQQSQTTLPISNGSTPSSLGSPLRPTGDKQQDAKAAPLGLTKVTFAGFWAMSVTTISTGSPNHWFLIFAATAIASGLFWRLLTHSKNKDMVETANAASFFTHLCIAVATVLFTVMAWEAANKLQVNTCASRQ